ncbi:MAG: hypothetical protein ABSA86_10605 [Oryzomonas sp.]|jgi:coenzyme F420-reducing hydrogenase delta subunit
MAEKGRFRMKTDYVSAAEAEKFAQVTSDFIAAIRTLTASRADQHSWR